MASIEATVIERILFMSGLPFELQPELTIAQLKSYPHPSEILNLYKDGFRKAGLPEQ